MNHDLKVWSDVFLEDDGQWHWRVVTPVDEHMGFAPSIEEANAQAREALINEVDKEFA